MNTKTTKKDYAVVETDDVQKISTTSGYVPIVGTPTDPVIEAPGDGSSTTEYTVSAIEPTGSPKTTGRRDQTTGYSISVDSITQSYLDPTTGNWTPIRATTGLPFSLNITAGGTPTTVSNDEQFVVEVTNLPNYTTYDVRVVVVYTLTVGTESNTVTVTVTRPKF